jgi:putative endonuclease
MSVRVKNSVSLIFCIENALKLASRYLFAKKQINSKRHIQTIFLNSLMQIYIYLYILLCSDKTYYTGVTNNLEKRIKQHQEGINVESYTYTRRPIQLVYHELFTDFNLAFDWETKIKKWSKIKKEALINGNFNLLPTLSKKKFK